MRHGIRITTGDKRQFMRDSMGSSADRPCNSTLTTKGALLSATKAVLHEIDTDRDMQELRQAILDDDFLDRGTRQNRSHVWGEIYRRYMSGKAAESMAMLAQMVSRCTSPAAADLILFYECCQAHALLYDLTACCTYELYQNARAAIDKTDVGAWLRRRCTMSHRAQVAARQTAGG